MQQSWQQKAEWKGITAALSGSAERELGQYLHGACSSILTRIYQYSRGLPGNVCQKRKWVTGIVIGNNILVAYDSVLFRTLKVKSAKPQGCWILPAKKLSEYIYADGRH